MVREARADLAACPSAFDPPTGERADAGAAPLDAPARSPRSLAPPVADCSACAGSMVGGHLPGAGAPRRRPTALRLAVRGPVVD
jgi:hypothetical protein